MPARRMSQRLPSLAGNGSQLTGEGARGPLGLVTRPRVCDVGSGACGGDGAGGAGTPRGSPAKRPHRLPWAWGRACAGRDRNQGGRGPHCPGGPWPRAESCPAGPAWGGLRLRRRSSPSGSSGWDSDRKAVTGDRAQPGPGGEKAEQGGAAAGVCRSWGAAWGRSKAPSLLAQVQPLGGGGWRRGGGPACSWPPPTLRGGQPGTELLGDVPLPRLSPQTSPPSPPWSLAGSGGQELRAAASGCTRPWTSSSRTTCRAWGATARPPAGSSCGRCRPITCSTTAGVTWPTSKRKRGGLWGARRRRGGLAGHRAQARAWGACGALGGSHALPSCLIPRLPALRLDRVYNG